MKLTRDQLIKLIQESYQDIIQEDENRQPKRNIEPTPSQRRGSSWEDSYKGEPVTDLKLNLDDLKLNPEDIGLDPDESATALPSFDPNLLSPKTVQAKKGAMGTDYNVTLHGGDVFPASVTLPSNIDDPRAMAAAGLQNVLPVASALGAGTRFKKPRFYGVGFQGTFQESQEYLAQVILEEARHMLNEVDSVLASDPYEADLEVAAMTDLASFGIGTLDV